MIGYIYDIGTRRIATKIDNVISCDETHVAGDSCSAKLGTGMYIISDLAFSEGEVLPDDIEDHRSQI